MPQRIVSVHYPKAGGTSLQRQLMKLLGDKMVLDYNHDPLTPEGNETADFPEGKTLVMGHFRAQRYASTDAYWATFLRHPVDFLISLYFFWKKFPESHGLHARFLREQPTIFELAKYPGITNLMSEGYFGGFDMDRFNFIGFHKDRNTDLSRLARDIDLPLSAEVYENRTDQCAERLDFEADVSIQRKLTDLLADDVAFYERQYERRAVAPSPAEYDHGARGRPPHSGNVVAEVEKNDSAPGDVAQKGSISNRLYAFWRRI